MYKILNKKFTKAFLLFLFCAISLILIILLFLNPNKNIIGDKNINLGVGWDNYQSTYAGSEMSFSLNGSKEVSFEVSTDSKSDQGIEILINEKQYSLSSPNLNNQKLTINLEDKSTHNVVVRHFCTRFYDPCQIKLKGIYLDKNAKIYPYIKNDKLISIIGDSISTIYGKDNYSHIIADNLGYELHNSSILGSTVTGISNSDNAFERFDKDLKNLKSDIIIIFLGTNDAAMNAPLDNFEQNYKKMSEQIINNNKNSKIFLIGFLSRYDTDDEQLDKYSSVIQKIADEEKLIFVNPRKWLGKSDFSDDVHPSLESQRKIAEKLQEVIKSSLDND